MAWTAVCDRSRTWRLLLFFLAAAAVASPSLAQTGAAQKKGTVQQVKVHGASLAGNLEGDSPDRDVVIYLPPSSNLSFTAPKK